MGFQIQYASEEDVVITIAATLYSIDKGLSSEDHLITCLYQYASFMSLFSFVVQSRFVFPTCNGAEKGFWSRVLFEGLAHIASRARGSSRFLLLRVYCVGKYLRLGVLSTYLFVFMTFDLVQLALLASTRDGHPVCYECQIYSENEDDCTSVLLGGPKAHRVLRRIRRCSVRRGPQAAAMWFSNQQVDLRANN